MKIDRLWAPWRIKYIKIKKSKKCVFCEGIKYKRKNYIILKTSHSIAMLNIFPYNNGHVMVAPIRHINRLSQLKEKETLDLFRTLNKVQILLDRVLKPQGYNIGINISKSAGAGITGHLHIHIVCRWQGDTNFMTTIYDTKIISQSLDELYKQLKYAESKTN
jgi:ATP adenylyltransferase